MPYYIKKFVTVEAHRFDGSLVSANEIRVWAKPYLDARGLPEILYLPEDGALVIPTLEGDHRASTGDMIIRGVKELYPCKPDIFAATYDVVSEPPIGFTFSDVVAGLKRGRRFARAGWNGKGMFIFLVNGSRFTVNREPLLSILGEGTEVDYHAHVDMRTATGQIVPWLASQTDILAEDWVEVA